MFEWSEEQLAIRDAVRRFVEEEVKPNVEELEHGETPPYAVMRKLYKTFGLDAIARDGFERQLERTLSGAARPARSEGEHWPGGGDHHERWHTGADGALGARPPHAREDRRLGHHGAELGV
jgi:hypothetical protein